MAEERGRCRSDGTLSERLKGNAALHIRKSVRRAPFLWRSYKFFLRISSPSSRSAFRVLATIVVRDDGRNLHRFARLTVCES